MSLDFSKYDKRNYEVTSVKDGYSDWASHYDESFCNEMSIDLFNQIKSIRWPVERALDLACGTGLVGKWLKTNGVVSLIGLDLTEAMLKEARKKEIYNELITGDMRETGLEENQYDLVTNSLADEHIPDLRPLYKEVARIAKRGGLYATIGYHQFFLLNGIPTSFDRKNGQSVAIKNYIHVFSDHFYAASENGWVLKEVHERFVDANWVTRKPSYQKHVDKPISFLLLWEKQ